MTRHHHGSESSVCALRRRRVGRRGAAKPKRKPEGKVEVFSKREESL